VEFTRFLRLVRRGWAIVLIMTLLGVGVAIAVTRLTQPSYTATTKLFVATQSAGTTDQLQQGNIFSLSRVKSYADVVTTGVVLNSVIQSLHLDMTPKELAQKVEATSAPDTVLVTITVTDSDARRSATIANALGASLIKAAESLETPAKGGASPVKITSLDKATPPASPTSPQVGLNIALGLLAGLALGLIIALLRGVFDTRILTEADLVGRDAPPLLGTIASDKAIDAMVELNGTAPHPSAEAYRKLRTNLRFLNSDHEQTSVLLASSLPGEGTTASAIGLALALSKGGQRVLLVDANLRHPAIAERLGLDEAPGLSSVLSGDATLDDALKKSGPNDLTVLTSGPPVADPSELLGTDATKELLSLLESRFEVVVIDGPPLLSVTDSLVLAKLSHGVVVIVGHGAVPRKSLDKALSTLRLVGARVLGVVLNRVPSRYLETPKRSSIY
jgi:capsular exopolysaccharide synthesis family protein